MRTLACWLALAACAPAATHAPVTNTAAPDGAPQILRPLVIDEYSPCAPHRVTITVDGAAVATVDVTCPPPPVPRGGVIVESSEARTFDGPPIALAPGEHVVGARDDHSGRSASMSTRIPAYGSDPRARRLADTIVVADGADGVRVLVDTRALLIFL
jgi:hypothetical protein